MRQTWSISPLKEEMHLMRPSTHNKG